MARFTYLATTLVLTATVVMLAGCSKKSPEELIQSAQGAIQNSDYKTAVVELKTALQNVPGNIEARLLLGKALQNQEQWADSEKELRKALELGGAPEQILPRLAHVMAKQGKHQEVLSLEIPRIGLGSQTLASLQAERANAFLALGKPSDAKMAIQEGEKVLANFATTDMSIDLELAKARLAAHHKHPAEALSLIEGVLSENASHIDSLYMKAFLLFEEGKNREPEAIKVYQKIVNIDPKQVNAYLALADIYLKNGQLGEAEKAVQAAEGISAGLPMVLYTRATLELRRGKAKEANERILQVLKVLPQHLPSLMLSAAINYQLGHYEKSRKQAEVVFAQAPDNVEAARFLAASHLKLNNAHAALSTLEPFLQKQTRDAGLLTLAGEAYIKLGEYERSRYFLDQAEKLSPDNATIKTQQATTYLLQGKTDLAIAELEQASRLTEQPGRADLSLILLKLNKQEYDQALLSISAFEKKLQNDPLIHNLRAAAYLGKKDSPSARTSLKKALAIDSSYFPAAANLARLEMQDNHPEAAQKILNNVLKKDPNSIQAMMLLADIASTMGRESVFLDWLEKAAKAQPTALQPRSRLITYYLDKQDKGKALAIAKDVLSADNESPNALNLLGVTQMRMGDFNSAITTFTRLTDKSKDSPDAYLQLGEAQAAGKQYAAARATLQRALELKPDHLQAQDALLRIALSENKPDTALQIAKRLQTQKPHAPLGFEREGEILLSQKRLPQAIKAFEQALNQGAGTGTLIKLHRALLQANDAQGAELRLKAWLRSHPNDLTARAYAGEYYLSVKRNQDAITVYEGILRSASSNVVAMNNLANLYLFEKDKRALATAEKAYQLAPNSAIVQDTLGWILLEQGQIPRALELIQAAKNKIPDNASIRYHYAVALAKSGKPAEARKEIEAALNVDQNFPEAVDARNLLKSL